MAGVPVFDASLVAFPAAEPRRVALLPADEADVAAALVQKDLHELLAVLDFVLMHSADVVRGLHGLVVDVLALVLVDDAEELGEIDAVVVRRLDRGSHLRVGRVADDDALAARCDERLDGGRDLLRDMPLVDVDELYAERVGCCIEDAFALRAQHVGGAPDGDTDLHLVRSALVRRLLLRSAAGEPERAQQEHCNRTQHPLHTEPFSLHVATSLVQSPKASKVPFLCAEPLTPPQSGVMCSSTFSDYHNIIFSIGCQ